MGKIIYLYRQFYLPVDAIVLWPFILFRMPKAQVSERLMRHEKEHVRQVYRGWIVGFYVSYLWEYFKLRRQKMGHYEAYWHNRYEVEARRAEIA